MSISHGPTSIQMSKVWQKSKDVTKCGHKLLKSQFDKQGKEKVSAETKRNETKENTKSTKILEETPTGTKSYKKCLNQMNGGLNEPKKARSGNCGNEEQQNSSADRFA